MRTLLFGTIAANRSTVAGDDRDNIIPMGSLSSMVYGFNGTDWIAPISGSLQNFRIMLSSSSPTVTANCTWKNITQGITVTMVPTGNNVIDSDDTHAISVNAGNVMRFTPPVTTPTGKFTWAADFVATTSNQSFLLGATLTQIGGRTVYLYPFGQSYWALKPNDSTVVTEAQQRFYCTTNGTIKAFYIFCAGIDTNTFSIYKNGSEEASTVVSGVGNLSVTGLSISFVIGDSLSIKIIMGGGNSVPSSYSIRYDPIVDHEQMIGGKQDADLNNNVGVLEYAQLAGSNWQDGNFNATESNRQIKMLGIPTTTLKNFTVDLDSAPGSGESREFRVRKNTANGNEVVTISGTSTNGSDLTNTETLTNGDLLDISQKALT